MMMMSMFGRPLLTGLAMVLVIARSSSAQSGVVLADQPITLELEMRLPASEPWIDTGLQLKAADKLDLQVEPEPGNVTNCDPEGVRMTSDEVRDFPLKNANPGAVIAKFAPGYSEPILIGRRASFTTIAPGQLFLGTNTDGDTFCRGQFRVKIRLTYSSEESFGERDAGVALERLIDRLPRRVTDGQGNPGDMINLLFIGETPELLQGLVDAGWVIVDRTKKTAAINAIMATYSHDNYLEMPMSELYLFGRPQDYGLVLAKAYKVVASRHHFRIWKSPILLQGEPVWLGSGTHDIGFEKDRRNGHLTHKIDPEIDQERDFILTALAKVRSNFNHKYIFPRYPFTSGTNASGGPMVSDGRIAVIEIHRQDSPPSLFAGTRIAVNAPTR